MLPSTLMKIGIDPKNLILFSKHRNGIVHGFELGSKDKAIKNATKLWSALKVISILPFGENLKKKKTYFTWQRLPRRIKGA
jgi:hypothetical protein